MEETCNTKFKGNPSGLSVISCKLNCPANLANNAEGFNDLRNQWHLREALERHFTVDITLIALEECFAEQQ